MPSGLPDPLLKGRIKPEMQAREGRVLCRWGDAGPGALVRSGKQQDLRFSDELVEACVQLIRERWKPAPPPAWVTCVPSRRHASLVPDFTRRVAARLDLQFVPCIRKTKDTEPQKLQANSFQQARNLIGAFAVDNAAVRSGPVLLVDDMVDSKWTFTMLNMLLREAGSGPVYPFALADSSSGDTD